VKRPRRPWTEDELNRAREMRAAGHFYGEIDRVLGRHAGASHQTGLPRRSGRLEKGFSGGT